MDVRANYAVKGSYSAHVLSMVTCEGTGYQIRLSAAKAKDATKPEEVVSVILSDDQYSQLLSEMLAAEAERDQRDDEDDKEGE
jgi:hypothetical protein